MSQLLDRRNDGSLAFFLDGDLQFDSRDEHIYHESLILPALAVAESRCEGAITALIIGGGDGLSARELLKSTRVSRVDLVDYDEDVLNLARTEFAQFNMNSLSDPRVNVRVEDAHVFVQRAVESGLKYGVIISDLTAPHNAQAASLHSVELYEALGSLLTQDGVLAVNTASPSGTPQAFWSIYNSILSASLNPRPYRIFLPSFAEQGYGVDWGFIVASPKIITAPEVNQLSAADSVVQHKQTNLRDLFFLPKSVLEQQPCAKAGRAGSDILVHYLFNPSVIETESHELVDTLLVDLASLCATSHGESFLLPQELHQPLARLQNDATAQTDVMNEIFDLMPALQRNQTRQMIADFLASPGTFLLPIDLGQLVLRLLERMAELPSNFVQELIALKEKLGEFAGNRERLFDWGSRTIAIIAVVVVLGNLMYPDAVYAKGHAADHSAAAADNRAGARAGDHRAGFAAGRRGGVVNNGAWVGGNNYVWRNGYYWLGERRYRLDNGRYILVP